MQLSLQNITKRFGDNIALDNISLDLHEGEILCLLGPSGCGKSTLLRIVAGLETPDEGQVRLNGRDLSPTPPYQRGFGLMFQDFALFPHKNVFENVAFGLRQGSRGAGGDGGSESQEDKTITPHSSLFTLHHSKIQNPKSRQRHASEIQNRVRDMLHLVGLAGFEQRRVTDLSGGEAQRVALARSLAPSPRLLMLDEPLGSLDRALRERLMNELRQILKEVGVTALYVTHDQAEAFAIADRVVVLNAGRIEQVGSPEAIYCAPATPFVARFLGLTNLIEARVSRPNYVESAWGEFALPTGGYQPGQPVSLLIRPEAARPAEDAGSGSTHRLHGRLTGRSFRGGRYQIKLQPEAGPSLTFDLVVVGAFPYEPGDTITLSLDPAGIVLLPASVP